MNRDLPAGAQPLAPVEAVRDVPGVPRADLAQRQEVFWAFRHTNRRLSPDQESRVETGPDGPTCDDRAVDRYLRRGTAWNDGLPPIFATRLATINLPGLHALDGPIYSATDLAPAGVLASLDRRVIAPSPARTLPPDAVSWAVEPLPHTAGEQPAPSGLAA